MQRPDGNAGAHKLCRTHRVWRRHNVWLWEQITRVYDDQLSVEDYLAGMQKEFEEEFAEGLIPPIPAR